MRNTVLKKLMTLALSACLILGSVPMAVHAEAPQGISDAQVQAFLSRSVGTWVFPVEEHFYEKISDYCGCRSSEEDPFYHMRRDTCQYFDHSQSAYGSAALHIDVTADGTPVMAPADGTVYRASYPDTNWGSNAVIEKQADSGYSYYIILGGLSADGPVASGTPVSAGTVVGYTQGYPLMLACVMDVSGLGNQLAGNLSGEMSRIQAAGWLADAVGTGMINVNPSMSTVSAYMHPFVSFLHGGVTYTFAVPAAPVQPTEAPTEAPTETQHEHTWDGGVVTVQPAEGQTGTMTYTCTICGEQYAQTLDALAHSHTFAPEWTYDENGHWHASACGHTEVNDGYGAHSWDGGVVTVQPAEGQTGTMTYTCTVCGAQSAQTLDALVHNHTFAPEWTFDGDNHWHTSTCGHTDVIDSYTPHSWDAGFVEVQPTDSQPGNMVYTCTTCGAQRAQTLEPVPHEHSFAPEWTFDGDNHWHAAACGHTEVSDSYGPHSWDGGVVTVQPTENQTGTLTYTCTVCGAQRPETLPPVAHQHTYADVWTFDNDYHWHAGTCGHTEEKVSYELHTWDAGATTIQPTENQTGTLTYTCTVCGAQRQETLPPVPVAHQHTFAAEWSSDDNYHWHAGSCGHPEQKSDYAQHTWDQGTTTVQAGHNVNGEVVFTCTLCGKTRAEVVPGMSHVFDQQVASDQYLKSAATCTYPAVYFKSCQCGAMGTETFNYGEVKGHTYSESWSYDETQHWQAATCEHTGERIRITEHTWDGGVVTVQPTETTQGERVFTCVVCGASQKEVLQPSTHQHTFAPNWSGNETYHWHAATCGHTSEMSDFGVHAWNGGVSTNNCEVLYTCQSCGAAKRTSNHNYSQMIVSDTYLKSYATCTTPAVYYYSCACGARGTETFTSGTALGHSYSGTWTYDSNSHWRACAACGTKLELSAHYYGTGTNCQTCGYARKDSHIHTSHLTRVPAKTATCTASGNVSYYTCSCGKWFTDVTAAVEIVDHNSVVTPAAGHVDKDSNGRCDLCREQIAVQTVTYTMTEGADTTWLNNSSQGLVFRCNADFAKFDHVEVDGSTISSLNYTVSNGSTIVELSASYMKRLAVGQHKIAIVSSDGRADASFSIKQGSGAAVSDGQSGGGSAVWTLVAGIAVVAMIAAAIVACYILYTNKPKKKKGGKFAR